VAFRATLRLPFLIAKNNGRCLPLTQQYFFPTGEKSIQKTPQPTKEHERPDCKNCCSCGTQAVTIVTEKEYCDWSSEMTQQFSTVSSSVFN
jgi:hypothetical protein